MEIVEKDFLRISFDAYFWHRLASLAVADPVMTVAPSLLPHRSDVICQTNFVQANLPKCCTNIFKQYSLCERKKQTNDQQ